MERHRSEIRDGRDTDSAKATSESVQYRPPRLKVTGTVVALIRGSKPSNMPDNYHDFYWWGER